MTAARTSEVDTIRGLALLGICVVNVPFLGLPMEAMLQPPAAFHDRVTNFMIELLFQGKFFVLFSFLFGWGFGVQMQSAARSGNGGASRYMRRLLGLFGIGILHAVLVFFGDILVLYAILGLPLWLMRNWSPKALLGASSVFVFAGALSLIALGLLIASGPLPATSGAGYLGTYADGVRQRITDWVTGLPFILMFNGPVALAAFTAGLAACKSDFFKPGSEAYLRLRARWPQLLGAGLVLNVAYALTVNGAIDNGLLALLSFMSLSIGGPLLSSVYLIAAIEAARHARFQGATVAAGRMSLTSYVLEGVIAGFIFNGYGLAQFGKLGPLALLGVALAIYASIHAFASLWLGLFRHGPLEMALRFITLGAEVRSAKV